MITEQHFSPLGGSWEDMGIPRLLAVLDAMAIHTWGASLQGDELRELCFQEGAPEDVEAAVTGLRRTILRFVRQRAALVTMLHSAVEERCGEANEF